MGAERREGLSIVIPSWDGQALLERFLPSVVTSARRLESDRSWPVEIVVADDASRDATANWLAFHYPRVCFKAGDVHRGFAATVNRGVRAARFPLVYLLNNDVLLDEVSLHPLIDHFRDESVFAVASQVYDYRTGSLQGAGQLFRFRRGFLSVHRRYVVSAEAASVAARWRSGFARGGSTLFDRRKFRQLGGFDEIFSPFGWEDVELSLRAWRLGWEIRHEARSCVWHDFSSTITGRFSHRRRRHIYARNRLLAHWIHLDTASQWSVHLLFLLLKLVSQPWAGQGEIWAATGQALLQWRQVLARRDRASYRRSLREVLTQVKGEYRPASSAQEEEALRRLPPSRTAGNAD